MIFTTIYLGENKIELSNLFLGKETVRVNDEIVSSKCSITGIEHVFHILENDKKVVCKLVTGYGMSGVVIDLYKEGKPIISSPRFALLGIFLILFASVSIVGLFIGLYNFSN